MIDINDYLWTRKGYTPKEHRNSDAITDAHWKDGWRFCRLNKIEELQVFLYLAASGREGYVVDNEGNIEHAASSRDDNMLFLISEDYWGQLNLTEFNTLMEKLND